MIGLYFILNNKEYAYRSWPAVPRIGDLVMLYNTEHEQIEPAIVNNVVWGTRDQPSDFCCTLEVEWENP